jgi:glycosyltransferase involved in cell wall biosynthesis
MNADHIHFRCPGNIGLLGCVVQIFFPSKIKTAKYAGNWDPKASQPLSYRLQKWILSHTFLTRNMQVLVYGEWEGSTKNIRPFFTATYKESDKKTIQLRNFSDKIRFLFVGTLSEGKQPLYALQLFYQLLASHDKMVFDIYGEGLERKSIEEYIKIHQLENKVTLHGNQNRELIEKAYQNSHFLILPSKSEGWPKVVAEAMFWGCVPVTTAVSCVPYMVDNGARGILLSGVEENDVQNINEVINSPSNYNEMALKAMHWSQQFTLDYFEEEIKKLLKDSSSANSDEHKSAS